MWGQPSQLRLEEGREGIASYSKCLVAHRMIFECGCKKVSAFGWLREGGSRESARGQGVNRKDRA